MKDKTAIPLSPLSSSKRILYLDSARGVAAISMITWHFFTAFYPLDGDSFVRVSPFRFLWYGDADMTFFFIHSGFILTYINRQFITGISGVGYLRFLIGRVFRIYPLFLVILVISHIIAITVYPLSSGSFLTPHFHRFWNFHKSWGDVAREALLVVRIPGGSAERYMPQDWTLSVELIVSAFLPLLSRLMNKNSWVCCVVIFALAKVPGLTTYLLEFGVGVFLFRFMDKIGELWARIRERFRVGLFLIVGLAVVCWTCVFHYSDYFGGRWVFLSLTADRLIVTAGCALVFVILLNSAVLQRLLSGRALVRIGEVCYGMYLFHILLLVVGADYVMQWLVAHTGLSLWMDKVIVLLLVQGMSIALAFVSFFAVERPMIRLGKWLGGMLGRRYEGANRISLTK